MYSIIKLLILLSYLKSLSIMNTIIIILYFNNLVLYYKSKKVEFNLPFVRIRTESFRAYELLLLRTTLNNVRLPTILRE